MKIALFDNDVSQSAMVQQVLAGAGHDFTQLSNGKQVVQHVRREECDLLIVDADSAGDGLQDLMQRIAEKHPAGFPVLLIAGQSDEQAILSALQAGVEDFVCKTVRRTELATRVKVLLRRTYPQRFASELVVFGPFSFDLQGGTVRAWEKPVTLTHKEFELALFLFRNLGRPLSRLTIEETVWRRDTSQEDELPSRTVDTHISRVRNKLGLLPKNGFKLVTVYGFGYCLEQIGAEKMHVPAAL